MRKSLVLSGIVLTAACIVLLCAYWEINSEKESVIVTEEPIWGDPAEASDITLQIASSLDEFVAFSMNRNTGRSNGHVLWDTAYTIGSGEGAESVFRFSSGKISQAVTQEEKYIRCSLRQSYGTCYVDGADEAIQLEKMDESLPMLDIISEVAKRTAAGEEREEIVEIKDYYECYPVSSFEIRNQDTKDITKDITSTQQGLSYEYLTDFFHISPGEDTAEAVVKKNEEGDLTYFHLYIKGACDIPSASAVGEKGCYYVYCCTDEDGNYLDRGQNKGIFYTPYTGYEDSVPWGSNGGRIVVDWGQIRKVCEQPEGAIPVKMLLDEAQGRLFLALRDEREFWLAIYHLEEEIPVFVQQVPVRTGYEGDGGKVDFPCFRQMTVEEGGILLTWQDNTFSFVAEEDSRYRLWYSGKFPVDGQEEVFLAQVSVDKDTDGENSASGGTDGEDFTSGGMDEEDFVREDASVGKEALEQFFDNKSSYANPEYQDIRQNIQDGNENFTAGNACYFDGERLVLAALVTWNDTDVLLSVYHEDGLAYCGLYELSEVDQSYTWFGQTHVVPQSFGERGSVRLQGKR